MFLKIDNESLNIDSYCKTDFVEKGMWFFKKNKVPAARLKRSSWGLGIPVHIKCNLYDEYVIYSNAYEFVYPIGISGVNYIALAIIPSWAWPFFVVFWGKREG